MFEDICTLIDEAKEREALRGALQAIIAAYDAPHYGDREAQLDHLFNPIEQARKIL